MTLDLVTCDVCGRIFTISEQVGGKGKVTLTGVKHIADEEHQGSFSLTGFKPGENVSVSLIEGEEQGGEDDWLDACEKCGKTTPQSELDENNNMCANCNHSPDEENEKEE